MSQASTEASKEADGHAAEEAEQDAQRRNEQEAEQEEQERKRLFVDYRRAAIGGGISAAIALAGAFAVGTVSGAEGRALLEAMLPTTRFLCSGVMTATATILALMLTLLSLSQNTSGRLHPVYYRRVQQIALIDAVAFMAATILLLLLNIPLEQSENVPSAWYDTIYYAFLTLSSLLGGFLIFIMLTLYNTVRDMISILLPGQESEFIISEEEQEKQEERG